MIRQPHRLPAVAFLAMLAAIAWALWPGLHGTFLLDDYSNLDALGAYGRIDSLQRLLFFLSSGTADPTGRPVALLSFLLDAHNWPAPALPFKRTNVLLHLLNATLLALAIARLQDRSKDRDGAHAASAWTPWVAAALWAAHPFFVSTTLYVVQREAMLPMTFVLLALLAWDRAIDAFARSRNTRGWLWAVGGFGGATLLAGLSKANGFLAPVLVGLAYVWFLRPATLSPQRDRIDRAAWILLALPSAAILAFLVHEGWHLWSAPLAGRDWTLPQRLLSEPRALWTYVHHLAIPRSGGGGVYVDDFIASRGWLRPWTTLPAMLALAASVVMAVAWRKHYPIACFAWLFFLAAHTLESSTVALELYFEHRNYLPAAFLGWPLAHGLLRSGPYPRYRAGLAALVLVMLLLLTRQRADVWGQPELLNTISATQESGSARAQASAARQQIEHGDVRGGLARARAVQRSLPGSVDIAVNSLSMECTATGTLSADSLARASTTLATARTWNYGLYVWLQDAASNPILRNCRGFGIDGLIALVDAAAANPQNRSMRRKRDLWHVRGRIALAQGRPAVALLWFNAAIEADPDADYALVQIAALGNAHAPALALAHMDTFQRIQSQQATQPIRDMAGVHRWLLRHYGYYDHEMSYLRQQLQADAARDPSTQRH